MIIKFNQIEETVFPNFKGGEKEFAANMFFDGTNRIFKGKLVPGATIGMHAHEDSCEAWGFEESDTTERLHFHFSLSCIGIFRRLPVLSERRHA